MGDWFDASPMLDNKQGVSAADTDLWLDLCAPRCWPSLYSVSMALLSDHGACV